MQQLPNLLDDPFLKSKLNPLFLESLSKYWNGLIDAKVSEEEEIQIKEALYNLVRFTFRHLFKPLFLKYIPKVKGTVFLLSAVHSDGLGDYMATLKCAELLKREHPELDVQIALTHRQRLPPVDPAFTSIKKENIHDFQESDRPDSYILEKILEGKTEFSFLQQLERLQKEKQSIILEYDSLKETHPFAAEALKELADEMDKPIKQQEYFIRKKKEAEALYKQMEESLALIHIALAINTFDNPALASKSLYFAEAGNFQGIANYLQRHWFSMGLDAFEEGIFLKGQQEHPQWIHVKLSHFLWNEEQPSALQLESYLKNHSLHVGYLPRIEEQKRIFVEMICRFYTHDSRNIDIILPNEGDEEKLKFDRNWMIRYGISSVSAVTLTQEYREHILEEAHLPGEKKLRLIYALPIPNSDFTKLIRLSGDIVGCTGDGSFSDCITAGKIPFYQVRPHKLQSLKSFMHLARILTLPEVHEYFEQLILFANWPSSSFIDKFEILKEGSFKLQWKVLIDFMREYGCFEDSFLAHVNRHLFGVYSWDIKEKEEMLIQEYFEQTSSAEMAYDTFEKMLKNRSQEIFPGQ